MRRWLITTPLKISNGGPLPKSGIYKILRNPFYYGRLKYKDELLEGKQPHIIEKELFDIVQGKLKPFRKSDWNHRSLEGISKLITCGECGDHIFEWYKNRKLKSGECHPHFYFRCSKFKKPSCTQLSIVYADLFKQLVDILDQMDISKIDFPLQIQREILDYFLINTVSTQNPKNTIILLRAQNQTFSEVDEKTIKAYIRYTILCKENWKKTEMLELLKVRFIIKDKILCSTY